MTASSRQPTTSAPAAPDDPVAYREQDRIFHDRIMQASGNRIARGVVRALESQVYHTARYTGRNDRELCTASNEGHRQICERIAAQDPAGAALAMFNHITEAWVVRRAGVGDPSRLEHQRQTGPKWTTERCTAPRGRFQGRASIFQRWP